MRRVYITKNNLISSVELREHFGTPYLMYMLDDDLVVNRSLRQELTKISILFDLEVLSKWKDFGRFTKIKGLSNNFLKLLKETYEITELEVKEAMENGKNNNKGTHNVREITTSPDSRLTNFTVG